MSGRTSLRRLPFSRGGDTGGHNDGHWSERPGAGRRSDIGDVAGEECPCAGGWMLSILFFVPDLVGQVPMASLGGADDQQAALRQTSQSAEQSACRR